MDWQLVASYYIVKSTDIFCSVLEEHFCNQYMIGLCKPTALENTFVGLKGLMTKDNTCPLLPYRVPDSWKCLRTPVKITENGQAASCQLFHRKIYGFLLQCKKNCQTSVSGADREIPTIGSTDNAGNSVNLVSGIIRLLRKPGRHISYF